MPMPLLVFGQNPMYRRLGMDDLPEYAALQRLERPFGGEEHEAATLGNHNTCGTTVNLNGESMKSGHGALP